MRLKKDENCGIINIKNKLDTEPLITHTYPLSKIDEAYELFENKRDGVIKVAAESKIDKKGDYHYDKNINNIRI